MNSLKVSWWGDIPVDYVGMVTKETPEESRLAFQSSRFGLLKFGCKNFARDIYYTNMGLSLNRQEYWKYVYSSVAYFQKNYPNSVDDEFVTYVMSQMLCSQ